MNDTTLVTTDDNTPSETSDSAAIAVGRANSELQTSFMVAFNRPRSEVKAKTRILEDCKSPVLAEDALYSYPRGGAKIEGPSVIIAREAAKRWGNLDYGFRVLGIDDEHVHIQGYAHDLETNVRAAMEDRFKKRVYRKHAYGRNKGGWVEPDERDLRELINKRGAIAERNAVLKVLPRALVEEITRTVKGTLVAKSRGDLERSHSETIQVLLSWFSNYGVSAEMLEAKLGHKVEDIDAEELAELKAIGKSIKDGNTKRSEHFDFKSETPADNQAADLEARVKGDAV